MQPDEQAANKERFQRFHDVTNTHDERLISDTIDELFDADVQIRTPMPVKSTGRQALKDVFADLHRAFPDLQVTVEDLIAEGEKVAGRNVITGTHQGEHLGVPPTGKRVTYQEVFIFRYVDGRVVESWGVVDVAAQLRQLGRLG
jgi:steroid delta-isomerase-like uncharacterized protein